MSQPLVTLRLTRLEAEGLAALAGAGRDRLEPPTAASAPARRRHSAALSALSLLASKLATERETRR